MVNKAKLFDANLAKNPVTAGKVIPVLVDFAEKMEELLDEMRILFDGLQPEVPPVAAENLPDISGEIPSLTGWGKEGNTETPTKPDQPGASEPIREDDAPAGPELPHSPSTCVAGDDHKDFLQDPETRAHVPASGIITNRREHRHGYIRRPGSFW